MASRKFTTVECYIKCK